ncbi:uncharacterized protein CLUP02_08492 [Colletotrichum lupini]|uniref:Uncharacterized protein n=1 Tax=Colletotrichum lupini TaxID=145971 RepID=A0A9Q8WHI3_9PEZI|nr:uncharacterized protein CLUP02_08492 [Colletotrichum lupini]UQC83002.1 hypothetical protein CLUP02_08492 [Colletotrichum lupini]
MICNPCREPQAFGAFPRDPGVWCPRSQDPALPRNVTPPGRRPMLLRDKHICSRLMCPTWIWFSVSAYLPNPPTADLEYHPPQSPGDAVGDMSRDKIMGLLIDNTQFRRMARCIDDISSKPRSLGTHESDTSAWLAEYKAAMNPSKTAEESPSPTSSQLAK